MAQSKVIATAGGAGAGDDETGDELDGVGAELVADDAPGVDWPPHAPTTSSTGMDRMAASSLIPADYRLRG
jgi:hypothetical protein